MLMEVMQYLVTKITRMVTVHIAHWCQVLEQYRSNNDWRGCKSWSGKRAAHVSWMRFERARLHRLWKKSPWRGAALAMPWARPTGAPHKSFIFSHSERASVREESGNAGGGVGPPRGDQRADVVPLEVALHETVAQSLPAAITYTL